MPTLRNHPFQISYGPSDDRLHDFYIPALERSVHYDRSAGFFSSQALSVAATGVVQLIKAGGHMRLLVGAQLDEQDVKAISQGHDLATCVSQRMLDVFDDPEDALLRERLAVLAWMIADGTLEIRVVLPKGVNGLPLPASQSRDYYHAKEGIFTDAAGDQIAFSGSVNESETGWRNNYEQFMVFQSWDSTRPYLAQVVHRFERLWQGTERDWIGIPIPEAVRAQLLKYRPDVAPDTDPLENWIRDQTKPEEQYNPTPVEASTAPDPDDMRERLVFQFLRDAPYLANAGRLGAATSAIEPYPHQYRVSDAIVARFPERFLIADEVGLGKTIEAGMAIRQLILSGVVQRCLILAPRSVLRQWQEELYEKFALDVPRYDGATFRGYHNDERPASTTNPFASYPLMLTTSQLAKRQDRKQQLLDAGHWDLIVVDEAHHARRRDFLAPRYRPNRLLELLMALKDRTDGLLLLTATPMQVHPVEVYDLLRVLGMGGRWGASERNFLGFFTQLRQATVDYDQAEWDTIFDLVRDYFDTGGTEDPLFANMAQERVGLVEWQQIQTLPRSSRREQLLRQFSPAARALALEYARRHTPLRRFIFRNTRELLREYQRRGILKERVPNRVPHLEWITMLAAEQVLYHRIEEYIADFYARYEAERKGLGFIMTVYRRRLTSSFYAICRSLERRLAYLKGVASSLGLDEDDELEQDELDQDIEEALPQDRRSLQLSEIDYLEDFLHELQQLASDSKLERLLHDLSSIFTQRDTVVVFTQYTDTMDYIRDHLVPVYGSQVACYSGRGGERWQEGAWINTSKEMIKTAFRQGDEVKILLCTEAASEGLNLQTCGVLINYDMPWNPMRVEQRIGRIDRIGQRYQEVWIRNYFYEDTIEATVYQRLGVRIDWFEAVVGVLQPILSRVARSIQTLAMLPAPARQRQIERELAEIQQELDTQQVAAFSLDEYLDGNVASAGNAPPLTLTELERVLTSAPSLRDRFQPHPTIPGAYFLSWEDRLIAVTFNRQVFDTYASTVRFLTYGVPLFTDLLNTVEEPISAPGMNGLLHLSIEQPAPAYAYYTCDTRPRLISEIHEVEELAPNTNWSEELRQAAVEAMQERIAARAEQLRSVIENRQRAEKLAHEAEARDILLHAALVEIAMGQHLDIFDHALPQAFSEQAIIGLKRHRFPFAPLLRLVNIENLQPSPIDPFYVQIQNSSRDALQRQFDQLRARAEEAVKALAPQKEVIEAGHTEGPTLSALPMPGKPTDATVTPPNDASRSPTLRCLAVPL
ncbi:MAG: DEAD/DEAH box helicase, partial [Chloroflexia bacterium]|nr:DEAD/DEAH box helicase [Chloroflexia bacterium]